MLKKIKIMIYHKPFNIPFRRIRNLSISTVKETGVVVPESGFRTWSFIWTHGSFTSCREPFPKVKFWNIIYDFIYQCHNIFWSLRNIKPRFWIFHYIIQLNLGSKFCSIKTLYDTGTSIYIYLLWKAFKIIRKKLDLFFTSIYSN